MSDFEYFLSELKSQENNYKKKFPLDYFYRKIKRKIKKIKDYFLYDFKRGILNLIKWFPIVWSDRDFDYYYIYKVLYFKINDIKEHIKTHGIHVNFSRDVKNMEIVLDLIKRLMDDEYLDSKTKNKFNELRGINPKMAYDYESEVKKQYKDLLYKILRKHLEHWWD